MHLRIPVLLSCVFLIGYTKALESTTGGTGNLWPNNDLYIDDEGLEGSGGSDREIKSDLEASGSGFGPDDEDGNDAGSGDVDTRTSINVPSGTTTDKEITRYSNNPTPVDQPPSINVPDEGTTNVVTNPKNSDPGVFIMNQKPEDRATSFFAQPGILAAVIGGAVVGLLCAILVVMFIVYRMRKKDEGSYALDEPKRSPTVTSYAKGNQREFYA
ncbi:Syndecan [Carabus blaptoides fortunei]